MSQMQENQRQPSGVSDALLQVNRLKYAMPPEISITNHRTHQVDLFQQNSYAANSTGILESQTGSAFIDPKGSWLEFGISTVNASGDTNFASGSALNVIQEVLVTSRTGVEISRPQEVPLYGRNRDAWENDSNWRTHQGPLQGYTSTGINLDGSVETARFAIPLKYLSPFFDTHTLIPSQIMEGLRIRITFAPVLSALSSTATSAPTAYTIYTPQIHWNTVHLADAFRRKINEISASRGLVMLHKEVFHQRTSATATSYNFEIRKAASKALAVHVLSRLDANIANATGLFDPLSSEVWAWTSAQARIGSNYFPQQPITGSADLPVSFYAHTLAAWNKLSDAGDRAASVMFDQFTVNAVGYVGAGGSAYNNPSFGALAFNLNKSGVSDLDGYVVNNSRSINIDLKGSSAARTIDAFLVHLRMVKVFPSNVEVKD